MSISRNSLAVLSIAALLSGPVSLADAQSTTPPESPVKPTAQQTPDAQADKPVDAKKGVLAGPKVEDIATTGDQLGGKVRQRPEQHRRPQVWMKLVNELELTEAQKKDIKVITDEMHKAGAEWKKEFGKQMRTLNQQMQAYRQRNEAPPQELLEKRRELRQSAPDFMKYRDRVLKELTEQQKTALHEKIKKRQEEARKRREEMSQDGAQQTDQRERRKRQRGMEQTEPGASDSPMSEDPPDSPTGSQGEGRGKKKTSGGPLSERPR